MGTKVYMAYRIWIYIITVYLSGKYSLQCNRLISRIMVLGTGIVMILINEMISAFLAPIFVVLAVTAVIVCLILIAIGYSLSLVFQRFNILHRK